MSDYLTLFRQWRARQAGSAPADECEPANLRKKREKSADPEALERGLRELEAAGIRPPALFRCHRCDAVGRLRPSAWPDVLELFCPQCERPAGALDAAGAGRFIDRLLDRRLKG